MNRKNRNSSPSFFQCVLPFSSSTGANFWARPYAHASSSASRSLPSLAISSPAATITRTSRSAASSFTSALFGLIKDDQRLFALRIVGRAGCPAASVLSWFRPARHLCYFCSPAFDIPQSFWESSCSESLACHSLVGLLSACEAGVERRRACDARARYGAHIIGSGPHLLPLCFRWPPRRSRREHHLHDALELGLDVLGQHALAQGLPQVSVEGCLIEAVALCVGLL